MVRDELSIQEKADSYIPNTRVSVNADIANQPRLGHRCQPTFHRLRSCGRSRAQSHGRKVTRRVDLHFRGWSSC